MVFLLYAGRKILSLFFVRRLLWGSYGIDRTLHHLISPGDGLLSVCEIDGHGIIHIKYCTLLTLCRRIVLVGCSAGSVVCTYLFANMFAIRYVSYQCLMLAVVFAVAQESMMRNFTLLFERRQKNRSGI